MSAITFNHLNLLNDLNVITSVSEFLNLHQIPFFNMGILSQIAEYLYLKKKDPNAPKSQFVKYMHGINRLSIILFLLALVFIVVKLLVK